MPYCNRNKLSYRVYGSREASESFRYLTRSIPQQKMGLQLVRIGAGTNHVQVLGTMCGFTQVPHCQGRIVPVQEYVPICERRFTGASYPVSYLFYTTHT